MNDIQVFNFESNDVRTLIDERDQSVWFVLRDVLKAMGSSTRPAIAKASVEEVFGAGYITNTQLDTGFGVKDTTIVSEPATTFLISRSNTDMGKKMNRWIHSEVIPSIQKTGGYQLPTIDFNNPILMAELLGQQSALYLEAQRKVDQMTPKAEIYDKVMSSSSVNSMKDTADLINRKGVGRNNLMKLLREKKIINSNNKPYRPYIEQGYFTVKERPYEANGETRIGYTPFTTQRGLEWIERNIDHWLEGEGPLIPKLSVVG